MSNSGHHDRIRFLHSGSIGTGLKRRKAKARDVRIAALLNVVLIVLTCSLPVSAIYDFVWIAYLAQFMFGMFILYFGSDRRLSNLFAPSTITFIYFGLSFTLGSYCVFHEVSLKVNILSPNAMGFSDSIRLIVFVTMAGQTMLLIAAAKGTLERALQVRDKLPPEQTAKLKHRHTKLIVIVVSLFFFVTFSILPINLSFMGGGGSFSFPVRLSAAIALFAASIRLPFFARLSLFAIVIAASALQSYESKREIIFVLIAALMIEVAWRGWTVKFTVRQLLIGSSLATVFVVLILWSSILRGYGNYKVDSPIEALAYIPTYVGESYFLAAANENFELSHVFGNTAQCISLVYEEEIPYLYGSTFAKIIFAPIPRRFFSKKPVSMITVYTKKVAPRFHALGGSIPVTMFGELFANFHVFGLVFVYPMFRLLDLFFLWFERNLYALKFDTLFYASAFLTVTTIQFSRGSGLEIHIIYLVVTLPFALLYSMLGSAK